MPHHSGHQKEDELGWYMQGSATEVADILTEFAQELRNGDINVWKGQRELQLAPQSKIEMRVEAIADEDGRQGFHVTMHWYTTSGTADLHSGANMGVDVGGDRPRLGD